MGPSAMAISILTRSPGMKGNTHSPRAAPTEEPAWKQYQAVPKAIAHCSARDHAGQLDAPVPEAVNDRAGDQCHGDEAHDIAPGGAQQPAHAPVKPENTGTPTMPIST